MKTIIVVLGLLSLVGCRTDQAAYERCISFCEGKDNVRTFDCVGWYQCICKDGTYTAFNKW